MSQPLAIALIEMIASIELANGEHINEDFAVALIEQAAFVLKQLNETERTQLAALSVRLASETTDHRRADLLRNLPDSLGIDISSTAR